MGGAVGPILVALFTGMSEKANEVVSVKDLAEMFRCGLEDMMMIGGAKQGDRTMIDALLPAVEALEAEALKESTLETAMKLAARAARTGAEETKNMKAKKGRAKFLQEKSIGYQDAGATSIALIIEAMADFCTK